MRSVASNGIPFGGGEQIREAVSWVPDAQRFAFNAPAPGVTTSSKQCPPKQSTGHAEGHVDGMWRAVAANGSRRWLVG